MPWNTLSILILLCSWLPAPDSPASAARTVTANEESMGRIMTSPGANNRTGFIGIDSFIMDKCIETIANWETGQVSATKKSEMFCH